MRYNPYSTSRPDAPTHAKPDSLARGPGDTADSSARPPEVSANTPSEKMPTIATAATTVVISTSNREFQSMFMTSKALSLRVRSPWCCSCLLYTSDAADEEDSVDLGGRRIIKKKK